MIILADSCAYPLQKLVLQFLCKTYIKVNDIRTDRINKDTSVKWLNAST